MRNSLFGILQILIFLVFNTCSEQGTPPQDALFIIPESNISFYEHIQPMFIYKCGTETGCHSALDIERKMLYLELVDNNALKDHRLSKNGSKLIDLTIHLENPHLAPLYLILLEGYPTQQVDQMPPPWLNRSPLNDSQLEGIKTWIAEGAPD